MPAMGVEDESPRARIAVVGAGWWGQGWHIPHLSRHPGVELVAIADPSSTIRSTLNSNMLQLEELGKRYGARTFKSHTELFESGLQLDGVVIATAHAAHYEVGMAALSRGLHVFMEKPMTTDVREAEALLRAVQKSNKRLFMVNNTANWTRQTRKAFEWVSTGRIGTVQHVNCYMGNVLQWLLEDPANAGWCVPSGTMLGNGFAWGQLSHTLAWVIKVSGLTPMSVYADMNYSEVTGADMYNAAIIRCTSGAIISLQGVATLAPEPGGDPNLPPSGKQSEQRIFGSEGYIAYMGMNDKKDSGSLKLCRHDGANEEIPEFEWEDGNPDGTGPESLQNFVAGCRGDANVWNGTDADVGYKVVCVLDGMYRSAKSGNRENLLCGEVAPCMRKRARLS